MPKPSFSLEELQKNPPRVLLLGNGINRAFDGFSWEAMLEKLAMENPRFSSDGSKEKMTFTADELELLKKLPYPMQVDIRTDGAVNGALQRLAKDLVGITPPEDEKRLLRQLLPHFASVLTTNYTYEAEKSVCDFSIKSFDKSCRIRKVPEPDEYAPLFTCLDAHAGKNEVKYDRMYTYMGLGEHYPPLWHIHGEAGIDKSMVIGQHYYGKIVAYARACSYILSDKIKKAQRQGTSVTMDNWVDWFMLGNVTIIGQGMNPSEFDLWWLITEKHKHYGYTNVTWYNANTSVESKLLAKTYGMDVPDTPDVKNGNFRGYYNDVMAEVQKTHEKIY